MKDELISIVTPLYNCESYILKAIESVINQTHSNWEMIIVDDCSTDNSFELVENFIKNENRIKLYKLDKNSGTSVARNKGIKEASGNYLVFLDSDDSLDPLFLEKQLAFLKQKNCHIVTCGYRRMTNIGCTDFIPPPKTTLKTILNGNPVSCLTTMININKTGKYFFDIDIKKCEDFYYWIKLLQYGYGPIYGNNEVLATYRILNSSKSRNKKSLIKWMLIVYKKAGLSFISRYYHLIRWGFYGIKKYKNVR